MSHVEIQSLTRKIFYECNLQLREKGIPVRVESCGDTDLITFYPTDGKTRPDADSIRSAQALLEACFSKVLR